MDKMSIKEARKSKGYTIKAVSDLTGVPYRTLQNWESGIRPCPEYIRRLIVKEIMCCEHCPHLAHKPQEDEREQ